MTDTMTSTQIAVEADDVTAGYGAVEVLRGVSCRIPESGFAGIIGPNGAGKTTLLRALSGVLPLSRGIVRVLGRDVRAFERRELSRQLAFVPQGFGVPVAFTTAELVAMGRTPYVAGWSRLSSHDREVVRRSMEMTGILDLQDRSLDELSSGERQRVVVAMALAQEPRVLLLDEPTAHLDIQHAWHLMEIIRELNRVHKVTVVLTSHDLNLAGEFCESLLLLNNGAVVTSGTAQEVLVPEVLSRVYEHPLDVFRMPPGDRLIVAPRRREN